MRLRTSLFELSCHPTPEEALSASSRRISAGDAAFRTLGVEDSLAYALGCATFSPRRGTLQWACDAWMICANAAGFDTRQFLTRLAHARLTLPVSVLLRYLADTGMPMPDGLATAVNAAAGNAGPMDRDVALHGVRRAVPGGLRAMVSRLPDPRTRLALLAWSLWPSGDFIRWVRPPRHPLLTPLSYLSRAARGAGVSPRR